MACKRGREVGVNVVRNHDNFLPTYAPGASLMPNRVWGGAGASMYQKGASMYLEP